MPLPLDLADLASDIAQALDGFCHRHWSWLCERSHLRPGWYLG